MRRLADRRLVSLAADRQFLMDRPDGRELHVSITDAVLEHLCAMDVSIR